MITENGGSRAIRRRPPCIIFGKVGRDDLPKGKIRSAKPESNGFKNFEGLGVEPQHLMLANGFATISLIHAETPRRFDARNAFASGGVYEDPATGAAAAALAGYLRDLDWPHGGAIEIAQGEDMGVPSRLHAEITPKIGASIRVSGSVRVLPPEAM